jgi:hypothetical protein
MSAADIEWTLERWFASQGPDHVADRVVEAALETIGTTAQSRGPHEGLGAGRGVRGRIEGLDRGRTLALAATIAGVGLVGAIAMTGAVRPAPTTQPDTVRPSQPPDAALPSPPLASLSPAIPRGTQFTSPLHGYRISYPKGWVATPGSVGSTVDTFVLDAEGSDRFVFKVAVSQLPDGVEIETWLTNAPSTRPFDSGSVARCEGGRTTTVEAAGWVISPFAGYRGWRRVACGGVDGVVAVGGSAYVFSAEGPVLDQRTDERTVRYFETFVGTFRPPPVSTAAMVPFTSDLYGYSLEHPVDWVVTRATRPWVPGELPLRYDAADRFTDGRLGGRPLSVGVVSASVPDGMTIDEWLARYVMVRRTDRSGGCSGAPSGLIGPFGPAPGSPEPWHQTSIAGQDGHVRRACGTIDGVFVESGRAYVISAEGRYRYEGAAEETEATFQAFVDTIDLHPEMAVDTAGG